MKRLQLTGIIAATALAVGCAASPERLREMSDRQLCKHYGWLKATNSAADNRGGVRLEIMARRLLLDSDFDAAERGLLKIGAPECLLYASWGVPATVNSTTTAAGTRLQAVYGLRGKRNYVYVENGKIVAVQN